jgi:hypothetical protein
VRDGVERVRVGRRERESRDTTVSVGDKGRGYTHKRVQGLRLDMSSHTRGRARLTLTHPLPLARFFPVPPSLPVSLCRRRRLSHLFFIKNSNRKGNKSQVQDGESLAGWVEGRAGRRSGFERSKGSRSGSKGLGRTVWVERSGSNGLGATSNPGGGKSTTKDQKPSKQQTSSQIC